MVVRLFGTRLFVEGDGQYKTKMRDAGRAGQDALARVAKSTTPASRGLRLVSVAGVELRQSLQGVAGQVPAVGRLAGVMGPAGLAVAAAVGGIALAAAKITQGARTAAAEIAAIGDAADRVQIDVDLFERLKAALTLEGQTDQGLEVALATFVKQMGEAQAGAKSTVQAFAQLGVSQQELVRLSPEKALMAIADGFAAISDPAQRAALAQRLFGEQGRAFLTILDDGSDALREQFDAAERLGLLYGGEVIRTAQQLNIEFDRQAKIIDVQLKKAFLEAGPQVSALREQFVTLIPVILQFVGAVAAGARELLGLLGLVGRTAELQLKVNTEELEGFRTELARRESGDFPGLNEVIGDRISESLPFLEGMQIDPLRPGAGLSTEELRQRISTLTADNRLLETQKRQREEDLRRLTLPSDINVTVPDVLPAGGGAGGGGGKGGGKAKPERDPFAEEIERIRERTEALRFEAETAGMAAEVIAYLETVRRLESAATKDGTDVSREERQAIVELAAAQADATAAKERATEASRDLADAEREAERRAQDLKESLDEMGRSVGASLGGLIAGTNSWRDALGEVLDVVLRIVDQQLQRSGFMDRAGSVLGGIFEGVFGGLFARGAAFSAGNVVPFAAGTVFTQPTFFPMSGGRVGMMGERPPGEVLLPLTRTAGGELAVRSPGGGGGGVVYAPVYHVDARGAVEGTAVLIERALTNYDRQVAGPSIRNASMRRKV